MHFIFSKENIQRSKKRISFTPPFSFSCSLYFIPYSYLKLNVTPAKIVIIRLGNGSNKRLWDKSS